MGIAVCGALAICLMEPSDNALTRFIRATMLFGFAAIIVILVSVIVLLVVILKQGGNDDGGGDGG